MYIDVHKTKVKDRSCPIFRSKEITCRGPVLPGRRGSQAWQFIYEQATIYVTNLSIFSNKRQGKPFRSRSSLGFWLICSHYWRLLKSSGCSLFTSPANQVTDVQAIPLLPPSVLLRYRHLKTKGGEKQGEAVNMKRSPSTGVLTVKVRAGGACTAELKENKFVTSVLIHTQLLCRGASKL